MRKLFVLISLLVFISGCKFEEAASMGLSKEMCSCIFVSEQSEKHCESVTKESQNLAKYKIDYKKRRVYAAGLGYLAVSTVHPKGDRYGCVIRAVKREDSWARR